MKTTIFFILLLTLLAACAKNSEQIACTMEAKICPDGTSVGRDSNNNCEFSPCSDEKPIPVELDGGIGLTNPYVKYASSNPEECKLMLFQCIEGSTSFNDDTGCGCKAIEPKKYIGKSADECSRIRYMCEKNHIPFNDENGCGCEFTFEVPQEQGKMQATDCLPEQRNAEVCTEEYSPVCGWFNPEKIQCIKYPCAQTFSNNCEACKEENIISYTVGDCPSN